LSEYTIHTGWKDLELFVYPEISRSELDEDFYKLKELCGNGIDFVHQDDIIELQTIIVEPQVINLYFRSLKGFLLNKKPSAISSSWRLIHFNEAIQDKEVHPLMYIDPNKVDSSTIAKLLLLIG
jgi:hypothetical protein